MTALRFSAVPSSAVLPLIVVSVVVLRQISTANGFTSFPLASSPKIPKSCRPPSACTSTTALYFLEQDAKASENDLFNDEVTATTTTIIDEHIKEKASFTTTASQNPDWKAAVDELLEGIIVSTSSADSPLIAEDLTTAPLSSSPSSSLLIDQQEQFSRALLEARLKLEQRKRYDQQEQFSRALLEARLKMERRQHQKVHNSIDNEFVFRQLLEARLQLEQKQRRRRMLMMENDEVLQASARKKNDLVFLFVGQYHSNSFEDIVTYTQNKLQQEHQGSTPTPEVVAVLGGGVIGGGNEMDLTKSPSMSILYGNLPDNAKATLFQYEDGVDKEIDVIFKPCKEEEEEDQVLLGDQQQPEEQRRPPSYMVFSDPFAPLSELLQHIEQEAKKSLSPPPVIAGGVTVPPYQRRMASIARNGKLLPPGSLVGVQFTGTVGLTAVVAQGCRPVGPTYVITKSSGAVLTGLSGESPISRLEEVAATAEPRDQELIRNGELVCGLGSNGDQNIIVGAAESSNDNDNDDENGNEDSTNTNMKEEGMVKIKDDFLIRQIMGFQPRSGSIRVAAGGLKEGMVFRFHVRAAKSAREDMDLMIQRAKTERLFAGSSNLLKTSDGSGGSISATVGKPLAAFQFSCVARGRKFYGETNVDFNRVKELFDEDDNKDHEEDEEGASSSSPPIAGFFANGEIGPVGIRTAEMVAAAQQEHNENHDDDQSSTTSSTTFLHGFTTVVAMLCDYSETSTSSAFVEEVSTSAIIVDNFDDAWA